jgi:hypothetical protein
MSRTIDQSPERIQCVDSATDSLARAQKALLMCGIASSPLYGAMIWVIRCNGYSPLTPNRQRAVGVARSAAASRARPPRKAIRLRRLARRGLLTP